MHVNENNETLLSCLSSFFLSVLQLVCSCFLVHIIIIYIKRNTYSSLAPKRPAVCVCVHDARISHLFHKLWPTRSADTHRASCVTSSLVSISILVLFIHFMLIRMRAHAHAHGHKIRVLMLSPRQMLGNL